MRILNWQLVVVIGCPFATDIISFGNRGFYAKWSMPKWLYIPLPPTDLMLYINTHTHTHTYMQRAHRGSVNQTQLPCLSEAHKFASNNFPLFFSLPPQPFLFPIFSLAFFGKVNSVGGKKRGAEVHLCWSFSISLPHVR